MRCFAFNLEWVGGILAPGNTLCEGAGRQIRISAEEDEVYDWRLIRRGGWRDAITPAEISARSSLAVIQPGQWGKGSRAINYNASCSPRTLRRHPPAPGGAQHWVGVEEQSAFQRNQMSCRFKLFLREEFVSKIIEARGGARRPCSSTFWLCEPGRSVHLLEPQFNPP